MRREQPHGTTRQTRHKNIHDGRGRTNVETQILRDVADDRMPGVLALCVDVIQRAGVFDFAEDRLEQRRLAGAVWSDQRSQLPAMDVEIDVVENDQIARADAEMFNARAADFRAIVGSRGAVMKNRLKNFDHSSIDDYITSIKNF